VQRILLSGMGTLFAVLFALTLGYPNSLHYPLLYPQLLIIATAALFYLLAVRDGRASRGHPATNAAAQSAADAGAVASGPTPPAASYPLGLLRFLATAALAVLYVATWETAGYFLDTFLFTVILLIVLGERKLVFIAGLPALLTAVVYVVFFRLLYLPLPLGPFEELLR
jgi:Tripartite tricarboxylate transporter TctB family